MLISGCIVSPNLYHAPDRAGSRCICQKKRCISEPPVVAVQTQGLFESEDSSMVVCNFALPQRSFYGNLMKTGHFSISWSFIDLFVEKLRCHFFASPVKDDSKPQKRRRKVRKFPTHADLDVTVTEPAEKNSCPKPCSRLHHFLISSSLSLMQGALDIDISTDTDGFCCRPRPILENRDTIFSSSKGILPLILCWLGGLVKHHPGRVTSACENVSKSQEMAVNPPTHRSFTCYNLLEPACPSPLTLRSTNSALNILTAHDFQHRGIGCSVWLPKMWTPSAPHNSDATFFLAHFLNTAMVWESKFPIVGIRWRKEFLRALIEAW